MNLKAIIYSAMVLTGIAFLVGCAMNEELVRQKYGETATKKIYSSSLCLPGNYSEDMDGYEAKIRCLEGAASQAPNYRTLPQGIKKTYTMELYEFGHIIVQPGVEQDFNKMHWQMPDTEGAIHEIAIQQGWYLGELKYRIDGEEHVMPIPQSRMLYVGPLYNTLNLSVFTKDGKHRDDYQLELGTVNDRLFLTGGRSMPNPLEVWYTVDNLIN